MVRYMSRKILMALLTISIVFIINFILMRAAPGDPVSIMVGGIENVNPELRAVLEERYGFNEPIWTQLWIYLRQVLQGDLGTSYIYNRPVLDMIGGRMSQTIALGLASALLALVIGTVMGILSARREGGVFDRICSLFAYVFSAVPPFWLALMLIILFASNLGWFPTFGMSSLRANYTGLAMIRDRLWHMALPLSTLVLIAVPQYYRIAKTSMLQVANEDFVSTLRATGMREGRIFYKYIFRNAILPTVTIFSITLAYLVTGVVFIEIVFSWPGMGSMMVQAINTRDYTTLMGIYLMTSVSIALVMILVDLMYSALDPRIRLR